MLMADYSRKIAPLYSRYVLTRFIRQDHNTSGKLRSKLILNVKETIK